MHLKSLTDPYALRQDGSKPLTANWDAGSFKITAQQLESDVAIGTSPLVVTSTTLVTNLNADLWDGQQFSDYLDQAVKTTSSPTFVTLNATNVVATDLTIDTNLIKTISAQNFVGINKTTPVHHLDVAGRLQVEGNDGDEGTGEDPGGDGDSIYLYPGAGGTDGGAGAGADGKILVSKGIVFTDPTASDVEIGGYSTTGMYITGKAENQGLFMDCFTATGDSGDTCLLQLYGLGTLASHTNSESLALGWGSVAQEFVIFTSKGGTGVARPLNIYSYGNANQLYLNTNGRVGMGTVTPATTLDVVGTARFGDSATNYANFAADGEMTLAGTARVINGLWIPATGMKGVGAKAATFVAHGLSGAFQFTDGTDDQVVGSMRVPNRMDRSVAPTISIGWSATAVVGNCNWQLEYLWRKADEDTTAIAQDTHTTAATVSGTAEGMTFTTFDPLELPDSDDLCLHFRLTREANNDPPDTLADTAELHGICMNFTSYRLGLATE